MKNILKEENPTYLNRTDKKALHILNQQKGSINTYLYYLRFKTDNIQKNSKQKSNGKLNFQSKNSNGPSTIK